MPQKFLRTIGYHRNNYIIEDLGHSWGTPLKKMFGWCFFNKGLIRLFFGKPCIFKALTWIWLSKVNGPALPKERWIKVFCLFTPNVFVHNRVPSKQLHDWNLGHSWGTPSNSCLGAVFNKSLIRHLIIWQTLHFQGCIIDMAF